MRTHPTLRAGAPPATPPRARRAPGTGSLAACGLLMVLGILLLGCSVRSPVRDATYGVLDAIAHPQPDNRLATDLQKLLQRYLERALKEGPAKAPADIAADLTARAMEELAAHTPEQRRIVAALVDEAVRTAFAAVKRQLPPVGAREEATAPLEAGGAAYGEGSLSQAVAQMMQRTAGATVRGAAEGLRAEVAACPGDSCGVDLVRVATRSATMGAIDGVAHTLGPWLVALAFVLGGVVTLGSAWLVRALRRRPVG